MLSSLIPHAALLKKYYSHKAYSPPGQSNSTTIATLVENIKANFERRFYTNNNSTRINLNDNDLFLLTTAVDPRYGLDFLPANLKQKVVKSETSATLTKVSNKIQLIKGLRKKLSYFLLKKYIC